MDFDAESINKFMGLASEIGERWRIASNHLKTICFR
jgi:hypothetical protein